MSFTHQVREELAHTEPGDDDSRLAEASAMLRFGGVLEIRGGAGVGYTVATDVGAVARRLRASLDALGPAHATVEVHQPTGLRAATVYRLRLDGGVTPLLARLGIVAPDGRPAAGAALALTRSAAGKTAYVRGALMVAGSLSDPRRPPHLEVRAPGEAAAAGLARLLVPCGGRGARASDHDGWRVTCKSGAAIGAVLARVGAHTAFLHWDGQRLRRQLRGEANRSANADRANLSRAVAASSRQAAAIERAMASVSWPDLPEELRAIALTRLASPEASLAEIGALLDPPVGKTTVHRRLAALTALAEELDAGRRWVE
ncbi:MAG TPA: DNA-binding protein WhiA [Egibacteraceae bacterium]|nr:DNA-binding protein WhiA [Egibacteraceae bacterium]